MDPDAPVRSRGVGSRGGGPGGRGVAVDPGSSFLVLFQAPQGVRIGDRRTFIKYGPRITAVAPDSGVGRIALTRPVP